jgi:putative flippase GtrA
VVGGANTLIDVGILFALTAIGLPVGIANIISTSCAFVFSFIANKQYTFKSRGNVAREMVMFIVVTLFGLWVLQALVISLALPVCSTIAGSATIGLLAAKLLATVVSLVWNYLLYSTIVFKKH